jgi:hypothetical protein
VPGGTSQGQGLAWRTSHPGHNATNTTPGQQTCRSVCSLRRGPHPHMHQAVLRPGHAERMRCRSTSWPSDPIDLSAAECASALVLATTVKQCRPALQRPWRRCCCVVLTAGIIPGTKPCCIIAAYCGGIMGIMPGPICAIMAPDTIIWVTGAGGGGGGREGGKEGHTHTHTHTHVAHTHTHT